MPSVGPSAGMQVTYILSRGHAHIHAHTNSQLTTIDHVWLINFSQAFEGATFRSTAVSGVQSLAQRRYSLYLCSHILILLFVFFCDILLNNLSDNL